jgi:hypothetical protein
LNDPGRGGPGFRYVFGASLAGVTVWT